MNRRIPLLGLAALLGAAAFAGPGVAEGDTNQYGPKTVVHQCGDEGDVTVVFEGATKMWPPNHKAHEFTVSVIDDDASDGDGVFYTATATHNQILDDGTEIAGSGSTEPASDITPVVVDESGDGSLTVTYSARSERSGKELLGRTYFVDYEASGDGIAGVESPDDGDHCAGTFTVYVPHDMSDPADRGERTEIGS